MKKVLVLILTITMVFGLGSCVSSQGLNDYKKELDEVSLLVKELQEQIAETDTITVAELEALEIDMEALVSRLDDMAICIVDE